MNYIYAFILGVLSIVGPCTFVMIPTILNKIKESFLKVVYFFSGILLVFILLGIFASITGVIFTNNINRYLYFIAGVITLISGLKMLEAVRIEYPHIQKSGKTNSAFADGLLHGGVILGCIGPQLAAILSFIVALQSISQGVLMIIFFALGFMFPFLIFALIITDRSIQSRLLKQANLVQKIGGILMITAASYLLYFSFQGFI